MPDHSAVAPSMEYVRAAGPKAWDMRGPPTMAVPLKKVMSETEAMAVPVDTDWGSRMFAQYAAEDTTLPIDGDAAVVLREANALVPAPAAAKMVARPDAGWATFVFPVGAHAVFGKPPDRRFVTDDTYMGEHALLAIVLDRAVSLWDPNGRSPSYDAECSALAAALSAATGRPFTAAHDRMRDNAHTWGPQKRAGEKNGYCQSFVLLKAEDIVRHGYPGKMEATMAAEQLPGFIDAFKRAGVPNIGHHGDHTCPWAATHGPAYYHDVFTAVANAGAGAHVLVPAKGGVTRQTPPVSIGVYGAARAQYTLPDADELASSGALAAAMDHPSWPQHGIKSRLMDADGEDFMDKHTDALPILAAFVDSATVKTVEVTRQSRKGSPKREYIYTANDGSYPFSRVRMSHKADKAYGLSDFLDRDARASAWDVLRAATATSWGHARLR